MLYACDKFFVAREAEFYVTVKWGFDVHGDVIDQLFIYKVTQNFKVATIGIKFHGQTKGANFADYGAQMWVGRGFSPAYDDTINKPNLPANFVYDRI